MTKTEENKREMELELAFARIDYYKKYLADFWGFKRLDNINLLGKIRFGSGGEILLLGIAGEDMGVPHRMDYYAMGLDEKRGVVGGGKLVFESDRFIRGVDHCFFGKIVVSTEIKIPIRNGVIDTEVWEERKGVVLERIPGRIMDSAYFLDDFFCFLVE